MINYTLEWEAFSILTHWPWSVHTSAVSKLLNEQKCEGSIIIIHAGDREDDAPGPDDGGHHEDLLETAAHQPRQDRQLPDGGEEDPGPDPLAHNLRQPDKTQGPD